MKDFIVLFMFLSIFYSIEMRSENSLQNLNCYHMEGETKVEDFWVIDVNKMLVSFFNTKNNKFQKFAITKLDKKTVAWNQMGNALTVFVLDKTTMRQSGTIISTVKDGQSKIEKRWFSNCSFISHDQLENFIQVKQ